MKRKSIVQLSELDWYNQETPIESVENESVESPVMIAPWEGHLGVSEITDTGTDEEVVDTDIVEEDFNFHQIFTEDGVLYTESVDENGDTIRTASDVNVVDNWFVADTFDFEITTDNNKSRDTADVIQAIMSSVTVDVQKDAALTAYASDFFINLNEADNFLEITWSAGSEFVISGFESQDSITFINDNENVSPFDIVYDGIDSTIVVDGEQAVTVLGFKLTPDHII